MRAPQHWPSGRRQGIALMAALAAVLLLASTQAVAAHQARAKPPDPVPIGRRIALECRLDPGSWAPCTLVVAEVGVRWWLLLDGARYSFHHDGRGLVELRRNGGEVQLVEGTWQGEALCWNTLCARGDLPLD